MSVNDGDVIKLTEQWVYYGNIYQNVFHVRYAGTTQTDDDFIDAALTWLGDAYDELLPYVSGQVQRASCIAYNVTQDRPMGEWTPEGGLQGLLSDTPLPPQVAALCTFGTTVKRSLGKKYIAGITEANNDAAGQTTAVLQIALAAFSAIILAGFAVGTGAAAPGNFRRLVQQFIPWTSYVVDVYFSTQRRRKYGVGI
jgi:hypothetical protein